MDTEILTELVQYKLRWNAATAGERAIAKELTKIGWLARADMYPSLEAYEPTPEGRRHVLAAAQGQLRRLEMERLEAAALCSRSARKIQAVIDAMLERWKAAGLTMPGPLAE